MPTLIEHADPRTQLDTPLTPTQQHRLLMKPLRGKNRVPRSFREDIERVYLALDGSRGLWEWAKQNPDAFYPLILKIASQYEMKETDVGKDPIRVIVYGPASTAPLEMTASAGRDGTSVSE